MLDLPNIRKQSTYSGVRSADTIKERNYALLFSRKKFRLRLQNAVDISLFVKWVNDQVTENLMIHFSMSQRKKNYGTTPC